MSELVYIQKPFQPLEENHDPVRLPDGWTPQSGLTFPFYLTCNGIRIFFSNYPQLHSFIKTVFAEEIKKSTIKLAQL